MAGEFSPRRSTGFGMVVGLARFSLHGYIRDMATRNPVPPADGKIVTIRKSASKGMVKTKFGAVTVTGVKPAVELVDQNVARSTLALERAARRLLRPGVAIRRKRGVAEYSASEDEPGVLIRKLDGKSERGRLVGKEFKVIAD